MKSSSRLLIAFGVAIGVLVIVAVVLVLTMPSEEGVSLLPEDTPEGTVQRFLLALQAEDYLEAYSYLSPQRTEKIPYEEWSEEGRLDSPGEKPGWKATLGKSTAKDDEATVKVKVEVLRPSGPFRNPVRTHDITFVLKKEGGSWAIASPSELWWLYW